MGKNKGNDDELNVDRNGNEVIVSGPIAFIGTVSDNAITGIVGISGDTQVIRGANGHITITDKKK